MAFEWEDWQYCKWYYINATIPAAGVREPKASHVPTMTMKEPSTLVGLQASEGKTLCSYRWLRGAWLEHKRPPFRIQSSSTSNPSALVSSAR